MVLPGGGAKEESAGFSRDQLRDLIHLGARCHVLRRIGSANVVRDRDRPRMVFAFGVLPGRNPSGSTGLLPVRWWLRGLRPPRMRVPPASLGPCLVSLLLRLTRGVSCLAASL